MNISWLSILCDPISRSPLELDDAVFEGEDVVSGTLTHGDRRYPIVRGIPRFVASSDYSASFAYQWRKWPRVQFESENRLGPMSGYTRRMFEEATGLGNRNLSGLVVLDMGCGAGRFLEIALERGALAIGIDLSEAIDVAALNLRDFEKRRLLLCQASALMLPIRNESLDVVYSFGVLHHTPHPRQGISEAHRSLKVLGLFSVILYPKKGFYTSLPVTFWRRLFHLFPGPIDKILASIYAYVVVPPLWVLAKIWRPLSWPFRVLFPVVLLPDLQWSVLDTFDAVSTTYQSGHTRSEVFQWLQGVGLNDIQHRWDYPTVPCFTATKV